MLETLTVLFEDQDLVVVNKPPGLVVNRADTHQTTSLQDWMAARLPAELVPQAEWEIMVPAEFQAEFGTPEEVFAERVGLVHRLDKDTSGVIVLAKNPGALVNLLHQFKTRQVTKQYTCLVHGKFTITDEVISFPIARSSQNRQLFAVRPEGREAVTHYQVVQYFPELDVATVAPGNKELMRRFKIYQGFSLVKCWPKTGRTHQIRVHMAHIKHPLVGDTTYVGKKRKALDPLWCPRQFLHASSLTLKHPRTLEEMTFTAELTPDLQQVIKLMK